MTLDDVTAFAEKLLSSQPTMASYGDGMLLDFPSMFQIQLIMQNLYATYVLMRIPLPCSFCS